MTNQKRIELYLDNKNNLVLTEFKSLNATYENKILKNGDINKYLYELSKSQIFDIYENPNNIDLALEYKSFVIFINDYDKILRKRVLSPILKNIKAYEERKTLTKVKKKKVQRKNKHVSKKIVVSGIALLIISTTALGLNSRVKGYDIGSMETVESQIILNDGDITPSPINKELIEISNFNEESKAVFLDYNDRSFTDKANKTKEYYEGLIEKYSDMYGLDKNLVLGIATQERGIHGTTVDEGGAIGLMQIQYDVWASQPISAYNFNLKKREKFTVDSNRLSDVEYNIKIGCMVLQNTLEYMDYNILAAVQCYNMGYGNMQKILKNYSIDSNRSIKEILKDPIDTGWLEYRDLINMGDQKYVEHVFSWMKESPEINIIKEDGTLIDLKVSNNISKTMY